MKLPTIEQFLATVHSADNMASARDKLAVAIDLLREVSATGQSAATVQSQVVHSRREFLEAIDKLDLRDRTPVSIDTGCHSAAGRKSSAKITANRRRKA